MIWTVRGLKSGEGDIFRTRRDRPWCPHIFLHNGCLVSFPGVKRPGRDADHPPTSSTEVQTYCCTSAPPLGLDDLL